MKNWKRYVSFFLSLVMLIGMVPAMPVYADEIEVEEEIEVTEELDVVEEAAEDGESGHVCAKYLEEHLERAATCGEEGRVAYWECDYCGAIYSDEGITILLPEAMGIPATGVHNWGEWFEAEEPAIGVPGLMLRFCVDCDAREEQEIPALEDPEKPEETPVPTEVPVSIPEGTEEPAPDDEDDGEDEAIDAGKAVASGKCGDNVSWTLSDTGVLTISGTGAMWDYDYDTSAPWNDQGTEVSEIVIKDGITHIGSYSFVDKQADKITLPASVTSIGGWAFPGPDPEKYSENPRKVYITNLKAYCEIDFQGENQILGTFTNLYVNGKKVTDLSIPAGTKKIGAYAFYSNKTISSVSIPGSVKTIEFAAFWFCTGLTSVTIANGVETICASAFDSTKKLAVINLPASVSEIQANAFGNSMGGNTAFKEINVASGNAYYSSADGVLFNKDKTQLLLYPKAKTSKSYTVPPTVTLIAGNAFLACTNLESITLPKGLRGIGDAAFAACTNLKSITIPGTVSTIRGRAFSDCVNLKDLILEKGVARIAQAAFYNCCSLEILALPETVTAVGVEAFSYCTSLESVTLPSGVTEIGASAFYECGNLEDVFFLGEESEWNELKENVGESNEHLLSAKISFKNENIESYRGNFKYLSSFSEKTEQTECYYEDKWFNNAATKYNHQLATMSLAMAMAAYDIGGTDRAANIKDLFEKLGFSYNNSSISYPIPENDSIGYAIGSKTIKGDNGEFKLIAVAVRGGGYGREWASNFTIGTNAEHQGFNQAATTVTDALDGYIENLGYDGPIKIWVTGYSRAAATSNIVGKNINKWAQQGKHGLTVDDLYTYCFECPRTARNETNYENIFNIINNADLVTEVAMKAWGFGRYGLDYYLPSPALSGNFTADRNICCEQYNSILSNVSGHTGKGEKALEQANAQEDFVDKTANAAASHFKNPNTFTREYQRNARELGASYGSGEGKLTLLLESILINSPGFAVTHPVIASRWLIAGGTIFQAHYAELCLAWMKTLNGGNVYFSEPRSRRLILNCPIDVAVYDAAGNLVAQIVNGEAQDIEGSYIGAYVDENGQMVVILPADAEYTLKTLATDDGAMSYQVQDVNYATNEVEHLVNYYDVPITEGEELTAAVQNLKNVSASYTLQGEDGKIIEADLELSGNIPEYSVLCNVEGAGSVAGGGNFVIGEYSQLNAIADAGNVFLGYFENGELISREETIRFRVEEDRNITARFISTDVSMSLDREYLAIEYKGEDISEPLNLSIEPAEWEEFLTWSVDADENNQDVIFVDEQGTVTVHGPGMAYALATVSFKDYEFTARCRVDISSEPIGEQLEENFGLNGIQLGTDKATVELYSTNYTELEILPLLQQNIEAMSVGGEKPKDNGVAVTSARFSDPEAAKVFDLIVKDDRTLLIVPKDTNADVAGSYSSAVAATIDGIEFETSAAVSIAVKKSLPKLTASAVTINPFFSDASAELSVSGGEISNIRFDNSKANPDYVTIEGSTIKLLSGAPDTGSSTLNLLADVEGWAMPAAFTAKLTLKYTAPQLKLSATAVTMQDNFEYSRGVELKLMPKNAKQTLSELGVEDLVAPEGYSVDFNDSDGSFVLKATKAPKTETITLKVKIAGTDEKIELNLKVTVTAVALKLKKSSISLASSAPYSIGVGLSVNPADYELQQLNVRITDKAGTLDLTDTKPLNVEYRNGTVYVSATDTTVPGYTYKVWLSAYKGGKETALTVSVLSPEKSAITSTVKASGTIDLSIKGSSITVTPSYKNYELTGDELFGYKVKAMNGKTALGDQSELFDIVKSGNSFVISAKDAENINPKYNYSFVLTTVAANGLQTTAKEVKLSIKESAIKLKLSPSSVNINTTVDDTAVVEVSSALKGYVITTEPIVEIMDKSGKLSAQGQLTVEYSGGKLYIKINENTVAAAYKLLIKAEEGHPASSLTVNILSGTKAAIKATQSVKGSIDVIRPATEISVSAPKFKGYSGTYTQSFKVIGFRGTKELGDYSEQFVITENDDGSAVIRATSAVDHSLKYKLRRELYLPKGDSTVPVPVADAPLQVKMGSAKFTADVKAAQLYELDKNSVGVVTLIPGDWALSGIDRVRIKPAKGSEAFTLKDFGGNQYAIGFADGYARITKGGSVTLEIFLEGNHSAKPNATVSVKLNVK